MLSYLHPALSHEEASPADRRLTLCSGGGCGLWWTSHSLRPPPMDHGIISLAWSKLAVIGREEGGRWRICALIGGWMEETSCYVWRICFFSLQHLNQTDHSDETLRTCRLYWIHITKSEKLTIVPVLLWLISSRGTSVFQIYEYFILSTLARC